MVVCVDRDETKTVEPYRQTTKEKQNSRTIQIESKRMPLKGVNPHLLVIKEKVLLQLLF